jgi:hypothetical protein
VANAKTTVVLRMVGNEDESYLRLKETLVMDCVSVLSLSDTLSMRDGMYLCLYTSDHGPSTPLTLCFSGSLTYYVAFWRLWIVIYTNDGSVENYSMRVSLIYREVDGPAIRIRVRA